MREHGTIDECRYQLLGWTINALAYEYKLVMRDQVKHVFVDTHKQLKDAIADFIADCYSYQSNISNMDDGYDGRTRFLWKEESDDWQE